MIIGPAEIAGWSRQEAAPGTASSLLLLVQGLARKALPPHPLQHRPKVKRRGATDAEGDGAPGPKGPASIGCDGDPSQTCL